MEDLIVLCCASSVVPRKGIVPAFVGYFGRNPKTTGLHLHTQVNYIALEGR
jgi:hypothetical protein